MCLHQRGENAMNIVKRYKDVPPMWKKKIGIMGCAGPWARPHKSLPRAAKILN